jgi:hypothetical protein
MGDWIRVATFEADDAAIDGLVAAIDAQPGPPEGVPATAIIVSADRAAGKLRTVTRFASEQDLRTGSATLDAMTPPPDVNMRRISVETFEILLERTAS